MKIVFLILFVLVSCNEVPSRRGVKNPNPTINPGSTPTPTSSTPSLPLASRFNKRLFSYLALSGNKCVGGENTQFEGQAIFCEKDQWLVTIDNMNTCDDSGCTSIAVDPIIAKLELDTATTTREFRFFNITPVSVARARQREILRQVNLRADRNGNLEIISKYY